jgi:cyclopropane fatty-acyl-phospholipid synthase-like methyltransferase
MTEYQQQVIDYFDHTQNDYRLLWGTDRHFGLHCGYFDEHQHRHDDAVLNMNRVLATVAGISAGDHVLDAGCGIGGSAIWLAENLGASVVGVNINANQVALARTLAHARGLKNRVQFHVADFCATELDAESFDVVWALESACYAEDKARFLAEAYRLLRPGGRLVVADGFLTRDTFAPDEQRVIDRWQHGWAIAGVVSLHQFQTWLRAADFHRVGFQDITRHVVPSSRRILLATLLFYPLGKVLHWIGLRTEIQNRGIASGYYQYQARRRGLGVYGIFVAEKQKQAPRFVK